MISLTSDKSQIGNFIRDGGEVFIGVIEKSKVTKQLLETSGESEYLAKGAIELFMQQ